MKRLWLIAGFALVLVQCRQAELSEKTPVAASSPFDHSDALYRAAKYEEAANAYAQLAKRFAAESNQADHWRARLWWVKSIHYLGRHQELAGQFEPLLEMSGGDSIREAWTRCTRGIVHARAARFDEALSDGRFGLEIALVQNEPALASACYDTLVTALSNSRRNRDIIGLWRVPDQSTARFVRDLYSEIHKGSTPSRALHRVRQRWIESGAPPSQWASFIVIGGNA